MYVLFFLFLLHYLKIEAVDNDKKIPEWMVAPVHCRKLHFFKKGKSMKMELKQRNIKLALASAIIVGSAGLSTASYANTASLTINALVGNACNIVIGSSGVLDFGTYDGVNANASAPEDAQVDIDTTCNSGAAGMINLNGGQNGSNHLTLPLRQMDIEGAPNGYDTSAAAAKMNYQLYKSAARTVAVFGTGGPGDLATDGGIDLATDGTVKRTTVYGRIPANQVLPAGSYADTISVTVTF